MTSIEPFTTVAATAPRRRFLPDVIGEPHVICSAETVPVALQRVTTTLFTTAIDALSDPAGDLGRAVAIADEALGRIVAVLQLVRNAIGGDTCAAELAILRDIRRALGALRAGEAEIRSLDALRARYDTALRPEALVDLREQLVHRRRVLGIEQLHAVQPDGSLQGWLQQLRRSRARFAAWPVDESVHGHDPVPDSFEAFAKGLERTYRKGRKRGRASEVDAAKWERSARSLSYQLELLSGAWPDVMAGAVATSADLADVLAEHERIGALRALVSADDANRAVVAAICDHDRRELMAIAGVLAARLYAEEPDDFVARIARYWTTRT